MEALLRFVEEDLASAAP